MGFGTTSFFPSVLNLRQKLCRGYVCRGAVCFFFWRPLQLAQRDVAWIFIWDGEPVLCRDGQISPNLWIFLHFLRSNTGEGCVSRVPAVLGAGAAGARRQQELGWTLAFPLPSPHGAAAKHNVHSNVQNVSCAPARWKTHYRAIGRGIWNSTFFFSLESSGTFQPFEKSSKWPADAEPESPDFIFLSKLQQGEGDWVFSGNPSRKASTGAACLSRPAKCHWAPTKSLSRQ